MSRSGYSEDCENWELICWRGAVTAAMRGKRGQSFLRDLLAAFDAMPAKRLITDELEKDGDACALGAIGRTRNIPMQELDPYDAEKVASTFCIAPALAKEIMFENDDDFIAGGETPEHRWFRMRNWVAAQLR
mgnify:FL=1